MHLPIALDSNIHAHVGNKNGFAAPALGINQSYIDTTTSVIVNDVVNPFAKALFDNLRDQTMTCLQKMSSVDAHSTCSYMAFAYQPNVSIGIPEQPLFTDVINWLETFNKSTGWYDRGFTEMVLEAIAFGQTGGAVINWMCIEYVQNFFLHTELYADKCDRLFSRGSHVLPDTMVEMIQEDGGVIKLNTPVTSIGLTDPNLEISTMMVWTPGQKHTYSHVISTLPTPNLRMIDLSESKLDDIQSNAFHRSDYGPSLKIGIQFTEAWWTHGEDRDGNKINIFDGQSFTDLPICTVVYPS